MVAIAGLGMDWQLRGRGGDAILAKINYLASNGVSGQSGNEETGFYRIGQTYKIPSMVTERTTIKNPATTNRKKGNPLESIVDRIFSSS